ncbi:protein translocase SEC61 complex subunit gamma [Candidatus Woesearchaeota archaeon]|nr:protein translocase SEC61 complex subunit gamma [Candidatus Woesearchaeota archaeon]
MEEEKPSKWSRIKHFLVECKRVLKVTRKPTNEEFKVIVKVSGLGMLIIGAVGFLVSIIGALIKGV